MRADHPRRTRGNDKMLFANGALALEWAAAW